MSWQWSVDPSDLIARLEAARDELKDGALALMEAAAHEGAVRQAGILDAPESFTRTGEDRVASGRGEFAGRHVTGTMIHGIEYEVEVTENTPDVFEIVGRWGWPSPEEYFLDQDYGPDGPSGDWLPAAHSLANSFAIVDQVFKARVDALADGAPAD